MHIKREDTIANIVSRDYRAAQVFNTHGLDFCCGGKVSLAQACEEKGLDTAALISQISDTLNQASSVTPYTQWTNTQLIKHIVEIHHQYVEDNVPYLSQLLNKIADVHGERHPELIEVSEIFDEATDTLYDHMKKEEIILFPAIAAFEEAKANHKSLPPMGFGSITHPIQAMEGEHEFEGDAFKKIAELTNDFTPPEDACQTYTVAFLKLKEFVADLHRHIHLENNILFENAKKLEEELAS